MPVDEVVLEVTPVFYEKSPHLAEKSPRSVLLPRRPARLLVVGKEDVPPPSFDTLEDVHGIPPKILYTT